MNVVDIVHSLPDDANQLMCDAFGANIGLS